ncbi:phage tail protein I [Cribrihabitans neustonicus]|uniref:phage tail protein I n=1 Tax=Cribrihabitans neustonicus TaxID=1429085 RepID=UPI003B5B1471
MSDTLLPHNATRQERALEAVTGPAMAPAVLLRAVWDPDNCPADLLPWLAFAFSVDVWNPEWSEKAKREVILRSFEVHRKKGTRKAVETALAAIGFSTDLSEWFEHGGDPHTFRIDAFGEDIFEAGQQIDAGLLARVTRTIETVKPARSHFELRIGERFKGAVEIRSGTRPAYLHRLETDAGLRPARADAGAHLRTGSRAVLLSEVTHDPRPRARLARSGAGIALGARVTLISLEFHDVKRRAAV